MSDAQQNDKTIVKLSDEKAVRSIILNSVFDLWKIVNSLTRLRLTKYEHYRVTIFGSARATPQSVAYQQVKQIAKSLAEMKCDIITGGGPGLMQAANAGAKEAGDLQRSVGIRVDLPFEQNINPFVNETYEHQTFFSRLHHFVLASDAFVIVPGGIGTTLEAMMVWQLLQVKHLNKKETPLIFVGKMWADFIEWAETHFLLPESPLANPADLTIPYRVETPDQVIEILRKYHEKWLSKQKTH